MRFYNIPEDVGENCVDKLQTILSDDLGIKPVIENAHSIGGPRTGAATDPRPVIGKFLYRPERFQVIRKNRNLKNGVRVSDDLFWEDRQKKKKLREVMKQAYDEGKKVRFHHGNLYVDGILYKTDLNLQSFQSFNDHGVFTIDELNELFPVVKSQLSALHLNIRSLNQHFTELCYLLVSTPFTFDFIGCSETWLLPQTNLDCLNIPGYVLVNNNREFSSGGGVGLFIKLEQL